MALRGVRNAISRRRTALRGARSAIPRREASLRNARNAIRAVDYRAAVTGAAVSPRGPARSGQRDQDSAIRRQRDQVRSPRQ
jgi:hypothetical protein